MKRDFLSSIEFLPEHRNSHKRKKKLTLDHLLDDYRQVEKLTASSFDLVMGAYRWAHIFEKEAADFLGEKTLKPKELRDLWQSAFSALMRRENPPQGVIVAEAVEAAKSRFGKHVGGITNAFLRESTRRKKKILENLEKEPREILGRKIQEHWEKLDAELIDGIALKMIEREESGVNYFTQKGELHHASWAEFKEASQPKQVINPSSWAFIQWLCQELEKKSLQPESVLDACAAPGSKSIALSCQKQFLNSNFYLTDLKFPRLKRLKENLSNWVEHLPESQEHYTRLVDWRNPEELPEKWPQEFDFIICDLPCSGSGTIPNRPDLNLSYPSPLSELIQSQKDILEQCWRKAKKTNSCLVASICSVDPLEIEAISKFFGTAPQFQSQNVNSDCREIITSWIRFV